MHRIVRALSPLACAASALLVCAASALLACASGSGTPHAFDALIGSPGVVTLTNLHPDVQRARLFAVNYQQDGLIPVCSEVALLDRDDERLVFSVAATGKQYEYYHHEKAAAEPFPDHLARYFGTKCPRDEIAKLPAVDRQGVEQGKALVGMSKRGVVLALGYPPRHVTPSLDADRWVYWRNRMNRIAVLFQDGRVSGVQN
jgi:hypothetical protein